MRILSRLRLRTKLVLLMGLSALAIVASIVSASTMLRNRMIDDRLDKLHSLSEAASGIAQALEDQVVARAITREQALDQFRKAVHAIHYDAGTGYIFAQTFDPDAVLAHGAEPALEGKSSPAKDAAGRSLTEIVREALGSSDQAVISYQVNKPGQTKPQPKVSYIKRFRPWNMVLIVGAFTDDLDAAVHAALQDLAGIGGTLLVVMLLTAWLIDRDIAGSLGRLKTDMERLASGKLETEVSGVERGDEVGAMASAVLVFKDQMIRAERLATEQEEERGRAIKAKNAALLAMAETIEKEAGTVLQEVGHRTSAMTEAANDMAASAISTSASAENAAGAAGQALTNAQIVASAAEQLTASIREIGSQVGQSNIVVGRAVEAGRTTRDAIGTLNDQVGRIGAVADMISQIAARTNLLALNATIEAARAGDAGKGFAVVAGEVKQLASQTAKSTEEISRHISEVRAATTASVAAVERIEATIGEINAISGSIAAAVVQQGAATAEIARNVTETAAAANEVTSRTHEVTAAAGRAGRQSEEVRENSAALEGAVHAMHHMVIRLVRTSATEIDRRRCRRRLCFVEATVATSGNTDNARLHDISERGCYAVGALHLSPGQDVVVAVPHFGARADGNVIESSENGAHIAFHGDGLTAATVDRISLESVADLARQARNDHIAFVKHVVEIVAAGH